MGHTAYKPYMGGIPPPPPCAGEDYHSTFRSQWPPVWPWGRPCAPGSSTSSTSPSSSTPSPSASSTRCGRPTDRRASVRAGGRATNVQDLGRSGRPGLFYSLVERRQSCARTGKVWRKTTLRRNNYVMFLYFLYNRWPLCTLSKMNFTFLLFFCYRVVCMRL